MGPGKIGLQTDGLAQSIGRFRQFSLLLANGSQRVEGLCVIGLRVNRRLEFLRRRRKVALLPQRDSQGVVNVGLPRFELLRDPELGDGFGQFVLELKRKPEIVVQRGITRRVLEGRLKLRDRRVEVGFLKVSDSKVSLIASVLWTQAKGGLEFGNGVVRISELQAREAEIVVRFGIIRLLLQDALERCDGIVDVTGTLQKDPERVLRLGEIRLQLYGGL